MEGTRQEERIEHAILDSFERRDEPEELGKSSEDTADENEERDEGGEEPRFANVGWGGEGTDGVWNVYATWTTVEDHGTCGCP